MENYERFEADELRVFCSKVLRKLGVSVEDSRIVADVLVEADLRGIDSHGVARMNRYVSGIEAGMMRVGANARVVHETSVTATIDGDGGLGQPTSFRAMGLAIAKAREHCVGFVAVRNSNHFGIAGFYAMLALAEDMIGVCSTNTEILVVPTFGRNSMLGTNPIAVAVPCGRARAFVLDMATSTVPRGKLEVYARLGRRIPLNWATDERGLASDDPGRVLENFVRRSGGGLLPLGGASEETGGHKGYGLALAVEVLCGVLSGACYSNLVYPKDKDGKPLPSGIGHFFGAMRVDAFRSVDEFKRDMDDLIDRLRSAPKAEGAERIYIHGEKEFEQAELNAREGVPLNPKVVEELRVIAKKFGVDELKPLLGK
jgi:LDH2 family malate/lactate/ureidoglycolate dehydrogenase